MQDNSFNRIIFNGITGDLKFEAVVPGSRHEKRQNDSFNGIRFTMGPQVT